MLGNSELQKCPQLDISFSACVCPFIRAMCFQWGLDSTSCGEGAQFNGGGLMVRFFPYSFLKKLIWERERERGTLVCCSIHLCIHWLLFACALTGDWTCNFGVRVQPSNQLSCPARTWLWVLEGRQVCFFALLGQANEGRRKEKKTEGDPQRTEVWSAWVCIFSPFFLGSLPPQRALCRQLGDCWNLKNFALLDWQI